MGSERAKTAVVRRVGHFKDADGREFFGALLEFPEGPPLLPLSVVWNGSRFQLIRDEPEDLARDSGLAGKGGGDGR